METVQRMYDLPTDRPNWPNWFLRTAAHDTMFSHAGDRAVGIWGPQQSGKRMAADRYAEVHGARLRVLHVPGAPSFLFQSFRGALDELLGGGWTPGDDTPDWPRLHNRLDSSTADLSSDPVVWYVPLPSHVHRDHRWRAELASAGDLGKKLVRRGLRIVWSTRNVDDLLHVGTANVSIVFPNLMWTLADVECAVAARAPKLQAAVKDWYDMFGGHPLLWRRLIDCAATSTEEVMLDTEWLRCPVTSPFYAWVGSMVETLRVREDLRLALHSHKRGVDPLRIDHATRMDLDALGLLLTEDEVPELRRPLGRVWKVRPIVDRVLLAPPDPEREKRLLAERTEKLDKLVRSFSDGPEERPATPPPLFTVPGYGRFPDYRRAKEVMDLGANRVAKKIRRFSLA